MAKVRKILGLVLVGLALLVAIPAVPVAVVLLPLMGFRHRAVETPAAALLTLLLAPTILLLALAVRVDSPGPAVFRQRRAGLFGKPFTMLKFRTMRTDVDPYGISPHAGDDPRLTRVGKLLRETSLDELPQLLNVVAGQMSLVGPRPLYERQAAEWNERQRRRLEVRPGITGYAQAFGRAGLTIEEKLELDVRYVEQRTFWLDIRILGRTMANAVIARGEVYEQRYSRDSEYERRTDREATMEQGEGDRPA
jgi:lipopolysaccharide/colanic/teichoic acid biosynthesis glycosyltransferase